MATAVKVYLSGPISLGGTASPEQMRKALAMVAAADAIYVLPGWESSRGARLEIFVAGELGLSVYFA